MSETFVGAWCRLFGLCSVAFVSSYARSVHFHLCCTYSDCAFQSLLPLTVIFFGVLCNVLRMLRRHHDMLNTLLFSICCLEFPLFCQLKGLCQLRLRNPKEGMFVFAIWKPSEPTCFHHWCMLEYFQQLWGTHALVTDNESTYCSIGRLLVGICRKTSCNNTYTTLSTQLMICYGHLRAPPGSSVLVQLSNLITHFTTSQFYVVIWCITIPAESHKSHFSSAYFKQTDGTTLLHGHISLM